MATAGFISIAAGVQLDKFSADLNKMRSQLSGMVPRVQSIGANVGSAFVGGFAGGLAAQLTSVVGKAVGAVAGTVTSSVFAAGDFEGAIAKARLLFGKDADAIIKNADTMSDSLGVVRSESIDAATSLGNAFKNAGVNGSEAAAIGVELANLGNDLAKVAGLRPEEAFQGLGAVLRGEYDSIDRFGLVMKQAMVNAEGLRLGLAKTEKELTNLDKQYAALSIIRTQGAAFEGAAAKLRGTFNSALEEAKGRIERLKEEIGSGLTPVLADFLSTANIGLKAVLPIVQEQIIAFRAWADAMKGGNAQAVQSFGGIGEAIGYVIDVFGWLRGALKIAQGSLILFLATGQNVAKRFFEAWEAIQEAVFGESMDMSWRFKVAVESMTADAKRFIAEGQDLFKPLGSSAEEANKRIAAAFAAVQKPVEAVAKAVEKAKIPIDGIKKAAAGGIMGGGGGLLATINAVMSGVDAAQQLADRVSMNPPKLAGAVEAGSTDARSAILNAQIGTPKDQQQRALTNNTARTAKAAEETNKLLARQAMAGLGVFTF